MTLREMLQFSGGVLGPALIAEALAALLGEVPALAAPASADRRPDEAALRLLLEVFPDGLAD